MFLSTLEYPIMSYCTLDLGLTHRWHYSITIPSYHTSSTPCCKVWAVLRSGLLCQKHCAAWEHRTVPKARGSRLRRELCPMTTLQELNLMNMARHNKTYQDLRTKLKHFVCGVLLLDRSVLHHWGTKFGIVINSTNSKNCLVQPAAEYYILQDTAGICDFQEHLDELRACRAALLGKEPPKCGKGLAWQIRLTVKSGPKWVTKSCGEATGFNRFNHTHWYEQTTEGVLRLVASEKGSR